MFEFLTAIVTNPWLLQQLQANQFLIAGIFAAGAYLARSIPNTVYQFLKRNLSIEFMLTNEDHDYSELVHYLEEKRISWFSRNFTKKNESRNRYSQFFSKSKNKTGVNLTVGYGSSFFRDGGTFGIIRRSFKENNHSDDLKEQIVVQLFTRNRKKLERILTEVKKRKKNKTGISITMAVKDYWSYMGEVAERSFGSVFLDDKIKEDLKTRIDWFLENEQWYYERGIPYKLGIMLYGEPGTGKSSLVKAIASYLERDVYILTDTSFDDKNFGNLVAEYSDKSYENLLVMEDLDNFDATALRTTDETNEKASLALNFMDGPLTPNGLVFVATTNHLDRLDPAIIRPGRFDLMIEIPKLDKTSFRNMFIKLWDVSEETMDVWMKAYAYIPITGATVQNVFMEERDATKAIKRLMQISV